MLGIPISHPQKWHYWILSTLIVGGIVGSVVQEALWPAVLPVAALVLWVAIIDIKSIFFLMLACIPISIEFYLPGNLSTDLPSEPFMWLLTLLGAFWVLQNWKSIEFGFIKHPITLALFAHLAWMIVCMIGSEQWLHSFKFCLAKGWYVAVFYFWAGRILNTEQDHKKMLWFFFIPLLFATIWVLIRHSKLDFSFEGAGYAMGPFFRNHVMYACLLAIFIPFLWYGTYWYKRWSAPWLLLVFGILVLLLGINFAYTRAAYVALVAAIGITYFVRWRKVKYALLAFAIVVGIFINFVATSDNWLKFTPKFEKAVTHTEFTNLLEATTKLEDISTMERVYRWVAASYMVREHPYMGYGSGNFYSFYKNYTVSSFKTYVSDNPEMSGMHNYFFMTTVEQGFPGLIFFLIFCVVVILWGERIYHQTNTASQRRTLLAALLCFSLINLLMLMNDFVETDKIGSLFFISAAIIVNIDLSNKKTKLSQSQ